MSPEQIDGTACIACDRSDGAMVPFGHGPQGQVFAHPECSGGTRAQAEVLREALHEACSVMLSAAAEVAQWRPQLAVRLSSVAQEAQRFAEDTKTW